MPLHVPPRRRSSFTAVGIIGALVWFTYAMCYVAACIGIVWVAIHFISKYW